MGCKKIWVFKVGPLNDRYEIDQYNTYTVWCTYANSHDLLATQLKINLCLTNPIGQKSPILVNSLGLRLPISCVGFHFYFYRHSVHLRKSS